MPEVSITERTPILANSSIAIPGLKHHQLSVRETFAPVPVLKEVVNRNDDTIKHTTQKSS